MPIVVSQTGIPTPIPVAGAPFVSDILASVQQDYTNTIGTNHPALIDYTNRVQLEILRFANWKFIVSASKRFITELNQTDYWIGTTGSGPNTTVDTGLNISDLGRIKRGSVIDRSNFRILGKTDENPAMNRFQYEDALSRPGRPRLWRNAPDTPNVINIYPAPDNATLYQPVPNAPLVTTTAGGALAARTYFVRITLVDSSGGESTASLETRLFVPASFLAVVHPPALLITTGASGILYNQYNVYISTTTNSEQKQNTSPIITTAIWTEPVGGLISGVSYPTNSTIEPIRGYLIEFRYYKARPALTQITDQLTIPFDYKDIVISGVNWLCAKYLQREQDAQDWLQLFRDGLRQMIKDKNLAPQADDYMRPDPAAIGSRPIGTETFDVAIPTSSL